MKTIILNEPGRFTMTNTAEPDGPGPGEVLLGVRRVGICGTDLHAYRGKQPFFSYPRILGHELGVEVLAVGDAVSGVKPGDRCAVNPYLHCGECGACRLGKTNCCERLRVLGVHTDGGMREKIVLPAAHVYPSSKLTYSQLALVETLGIGCHAVGRAQPEPGEPALVIGAGPIGLTVLEFLRLAGAQCSLLELSASRRDFAARMFPGLTLHETVESVKAADLPTLVFDCTGNPASMAGAFSLVANGGKLAFVGLFVGDVTFHDPEFHRREMTLLSSRNARPDEHRRILSLLEDAKIDTGAWISDEVAAEAMIDRFPHWLDSASGTVKAVVHF
ncbi:MAG: zinc-binding alcohol dehydrogenase family protein [Bryobacteraceae bacterium]|nr:zinc-binding alcohol dehydrogenase family protein [Bryobacteraceae bacterium]